MSLQDFHAGLKERLLADQALNDFVVAEFGRSLSWLDGNLPIDQINESEYPVILCDVGDGDTEVATLKGDTNQVGSQLLLGVIFYHTDPAAAFSIRTQMISLMNRALLRDPKLNSRVLICRMTKFSGDRGAAHPYFLTNFTVEATYFESAN